MLIVREFLAGKRIFSQKGFSPSTSAPSQYYNKVFIVYFYSHHDSASSALRASLVLEGEEDGSDGRR
jgi:hypothetical protein